MKFRSFWSSKVTGNKRVKNCWTKSSQNKAWFFCISLLIIVTITPSQTLSIIATLTRHPCISISILLHLPRRVENLPSVWTPCNIHISVCEIYLLIIFMTKKLKSYSVFHCLPRIKKVTIVLVLRSPMKK